jgi:hypothetical protein
MRRLAARRTSECKIGHDALIDAMRVGDNSALSGLTEDLGQADHRHGGGCDDIA